jgi:hypothetical protein
VPADDHRAAQDHPRIAVQVTDLLDGQDLDLDLRPFQVLADGLNTSAVDPAFVL